MPRDSHLLPLHSQQILRIARSPWLVSKPAAPQEEERGDIDEEEEPKEVKQGITVKKWVKVPHHLEDPEPPQYLAKRRKGLPSQYNAPGSAPLRETKVKKVDAEGNVSVYKALVPEGQTVQGEIEPTDVALAETVPAAAAPGTIVEGVGVVNAEGVVVVNELAQQTPLRRRHPPPNKKKGRRGRKKVVFAEGSTEQGTPASGSDKLTVPNTRQDGGSVEPSDGDTPMADAGDDDEGEEGSEEDGDEGEQSPTPFKTSATEADESVTAPLPETKKTQASPPPTVSNTTDTPIPTESLFTAEPSSQIAGPTSLELNTSLPKSSSRHASSSPDFPLSAMGQSRQNSVNQIPMLPSRDLTPGAVPDVVMQDVSESTMAEPNPDESSVQLSTTLSEGEMPLTVTSTAEMRTMQVLNPEPQSEGDASTSPGPEVPKTETPESSVLDPKAPTQVAPNADLSHSTAADPKADLNPVALAAHETVQSDVSPSNPLPAAEETNHPSPDLLGSLEAHLNQQS